MWVNENEYELLEKVSQITSTDYDIRWRDHNNFEGYIDTDNLIVMIEDLVNEIKKLKEEIEYIEQDREDNYRPISIEEQVEVYDKDFI